MLTKVDNVIMTSHSQGFCQGTVWNRMENDFSIFHTDNFLPFHTKIFFHIPYFHTKAEGKFRPEATRNLYCTFATLSIPLQVAAHEGKQYATMHLIPCLKSIAMSYHKNSLSRKISTT